MTKIIKVENCNECPYSSCIFDGNNVHLYCSKLKKDIIHGVSAPESGCLLKDYVCDENELKKENEEIKNTFRNAQEYIDKLRFDYAYLNKENICLKDKLSKHAITIKNLYDDLRNEVKVVARWLKANENLQGVIEKLKEQVKYKALDEKEVGKMSKRLL